MAKERTLDQALDMSVAWEQAAQAQRESEPTRSLRKRLLDLDRQTGVTIKLKVLRRSRPRRCLALCWTLPAPCAAA